MAGSVCSSLPLLLRFTDVCEVGRSETLVEPDTALRSTECGHTLTTNMMSARLQTKLEMDYQLKRLLPVTQDMETYSHTCLANACPVAHALVKVIPARCTKMVPMLGEVPLKLMYSRYVSNVLQCNRSQCPQMLGDYIWKSPPWRGITIVTVGCTCVSLFSLSHVLTF